MRTILYLLVIGVIGTSAVSQNKIYHYHVDQVIHSSSLPESFGQYGSNSKGREWRMEERFFITGHTLVGNKLIVVN